jgi:hypothetical protein
MLIAALPILVELFTSEGCSSCPPADKVLAQLHERQPLPGVPLLVLSEHVDYWNDLGWSDPFSDALFSERQRLYGGRSYTPQVVVDGRVDVLGSDEQGILLAARAAAREPHGIVQIVQIVQSGQAPVKVAVRGLPPHASAQVMLAAVEDGLVSKVQRGENEGRTLAHTAVVRALRAIGEIPAGSLEWSGEARLDSSWKRLRLIVFVQERTSRKVLAAAAP